MRKNVFFKSVLRQPVRTLLLVVLLGIAAFAFVARFTEFVIVNDAINRIEGFYRSIGVLSPISPVDITTGHDVSRAADIVGASRYVAFDDRRVFTQGVLHGRTNTATTLVPFNFMNPVLEGLSVTALDHYFIGTVSRPLHYDIRNIGGQYMFIFNIAVDELIVGDPGVLFAGDREFVNERGQVAVITSRRNFYFYVTPEEAALYRQGLFDPTFGIETGQTYLFRATPRDRSWGGNIAQSWSLRPIVGTDGLGSHFRHIGYFPGFGDSYSRENTIFAEHRSSNFIVAANVNDTAAMDAVFAQIEHEIEMARLNLSSVTVIGTRDMSLMPRFQNPINASLWHEEYGSRWITYEDYSNRNHVAVVTAALAAREGLTLGETFTLTLRDNPRPTWIDQPTDSPFALNLEHWWQNSPAGWWGTIDYNDPHWMQARSYEITLEIVGIYVFRPPAGGINNFTMAEMFVPASLIPDGFGWDYAPLLSGMYSYVLDSPRNEEAFIRENAAALRAMGFEIGFLPNGFETFVSAADPIRTSITVNLAIFSVVSVVILALVAFLYLRQWQKGVAVSRALGVPRYKTLWQLLTPVLSIWTPVIVIGCIAAWFFALSQAESTLMGVEAFAEEAAAITINNVWLIVLTVGMVVLAFAGVVAAGINITGRPVLEQLQGGSQMRPKVVYSGEVPENINLGEVNLHFEPLPVSRANAISATFSFITRHIVRAPIKSMLAAGLALFFVISLGWLNHTILFTESEIERLFDTTVITAEIVRNPNDERHLVELGIGRYATITRGVLNTVLDAGFTGYAYYEALWLYGNLLWGFATSENPERVSFTGPMLGVSSLEGLVAENTRTPMDDQIGVLGESMQIEFLYGFGPEDFVFTGSYAPIPVVVRRSFYEQQGYTIEDRAMLAQYWNILQPFIYTQIIGVFDGGLSRAADRFGDGIMNVVTPAYSLQYHLGQHWLITRQREYGDLNYVTARIFIDPARNRELEHFTELTESPLAVNDMGSFIGIVPLVMLMNDEVLHAVIEPMEQNLALLRVLYPIAIGVSIVLSVGLSLLIMLQNARNAAIMRVLGKPKLKAQLKLCIESILVCVSGVVVGLIALLIIGVTFSITPFALAGVYLGGAIIGSAVGAFIISAKTPLELLQVKE